MPPQKYNICQWRLSGVSCPFLCLCSLVWSWGSLHFYRWTAEYTLQLSGWISTIHIHPYSHPSSLLLLAGGIAYEGVTPFQVLPFSLQQSHWESNYVAEISWKILRTTHRHMVCDTKWECQTGFRCVGMCLNWAKATQKAAATDSSQEP